MFPGCTELDMRARQQDLLREAGYDPELHRAGGRWVFEPAMGLGLWVIAYAQSVLIALVGLIP
ncbi:MAG: hypothetical protein H5T69_12870 [Chloroflexi bacterium]|nr:hypothetical protein [Chloroflexota bacterium]